MTSPFKKISLVLLACLCYVRVQAQESPVKLNYTVNQNRSVTFDYVKTDPGNYTVVVKFPTLTNSYATNEQNATAGNYSGRLLQLEPTDKAQSIGFSYSYTFIRGKLKPKFDSGFVYLMPCKSGTKVRIQEVGFVGAAYFGNTTPDDWKVYRFSTLKEDTVTAIRKGIVVEVKDAYDTKLTEGLAFTSQTNTMTIEHADGTLAVYRHLKKGSFAVKVGQTVYPGTTLALNTQYAAKSMYGATVMIMYLKSKDFDAAKGQNISNSKSLYGFTTPHFFTAEGADVVLEAQKEYTGASSSDLVKKEMTKKEQKLIAL